MSTAGMLRFRFQVLVVGVIASAASVHESGACQCVPPKPPAEAYERAHTVVSGTVESVTDHLTAFRSAWMRVHDWFADEPLCASAEGWRRNCGLEIAIRVDRSFKGGGDSSL